MDIQYVEERVAELIAAIDRATTEGRDDTFNFFRGQLHVWQEVQRSMKVATK